MKTAEDLFKSITGFEEIDVNLLDGVHPTFNSLASRFEIEPDDNRNVSYPFEYCWQKSNENKPGHSGRTRTKSDQSDPKEDDSDDDDDDDAFDEMWALSVKQKLDSAADFGNEVPLKKFHDVVSKHVGAENNVTIPEGKDGDKSSSGIDEKS